MTFHWGTFLFQIVNFVVLAYVLHRLLYQPLHDAIDRRRQENASAQAEAEKARAEADGLKQRCQAELADLEQQRQRTVREAREQAQAERRQVLAEAERAAGRLRDDLRQALAREREDTLQALHGEVVGQALDLSRRLLREAADVTLDRQLARRLTAALAGLDAAERGRVREQWQPADGAWLETAADLDAAAREEVAQAVAAVLGQPAALTVQPRPDLLAGVRLRLGGQVWDASLAGQLEEGQS